MPSKAHTLGAFIADLMQQQNHSNVSLGEAAGVSEGVIRNLLKVGLNPKARDPDARTLRRVADALGVNALMLFRLAGYIPPESNANSVRAEYLADVFDELTAEKQDAVLSVLEAMSDSQSRKQSLKAIRQEPDNALSGFDLAMPNIVRIMANQLIAQYQMSEPPDVNKIEPDFVVYGNKWRQLPQATQERVKALIYHKLSLDYDPTMVDPEWRE